MLFVYLTVITNKCCENDNDNVRLSLACACGVDRRGPGGVRAGGDEDAEQPALHEDQQGAPRLLLYNVLYFTYSTSLRVRGLRLRARRRSRRELCSPIYTLHIYSTKARCVQVKKINFKVGDSVSEDDVIVELE